MGIKGLGNEVYFKNMIFLYSETDDTRRKRVSSLNACRLQDQLVIGELGRVVTHFQNIVTRPVVLQYRYRLGFTMSFFKSHASIRSKNLYTNV
jgi:hypothetical protein